MAPELLTPAQRAGLLANGRATAGGADLDPRPVVKLFTPDASATWLLTELDPDDPDRAFGLCDLGLGFPELGYVPMRELGNLRGALGLPVVAAADFIAVRPLSAYAAASQAAGRIVS